MEAEPPPDVERLAESAVQELIASGEFSQYSGALPSGAREQLLRSKRRLDDEARLEDAFAERMIALTRNDFVEEVGDNDLNEKVLTPSHVRPVLVDIYSDYCRPCNHILPVVYQLAEQYQAELKVVKINISRHAGFRDTFLGVVQMTPSFLFFHNGQPVRVGRLAQALGQTAFVTNSRAGLERRIRAVLRSGP